MQIIRNERAINNYFLNAEREYREAKKEYLNAEKEYREAKELSERYENKDKAFKNNTPTFEQCETLRVLISKEEERKEEATVDIEEITRKIKATEKEIRATEKDIKELLET